MCSPSLVHEAVPASPTHHAHPDSTSLADHPNRVSPPAQEQTDLLRLRPMEATAEDLQWARGCLRGGDDDQQVSVREALDVRDLRRVGRVDVHLTRRQVVHGPRPVPQLVPPRREPPAEDGRVRRAILVWKTLHSGIKHAVRDLFL